nr:hypothetical protein CoNPh38_CDS0408 [Staphylococcus phage S-CoN_Ph38]
MDLFLEYSAISTRKSTFTETFLEKVSPVTGALHGTFNETGTETHACLVATRICKIYQLRQQT